MKGAAFLIVWTGNPDVFTVHSTNIIPSPGFHIEYPYVVEKYGVGGSNGKIDHHFSLTGTIGGYQNKPYADPAFLSWKGGNPVKNIVSKNIGPDSYASVEEDNSSYKGDNISNWSGFDQNLKVGVKSYDYCLGYPNFPSNDNTALYAINNCFAVEFIPVYTENYVNDYTQKIIYDQSNNSTISIANNKVFDGANKLLPSESNTRNSKQKFIRKINKYAQDYDFSGATASDDFSKGINTLLNNNMLDIPIETYSIGKDASGNDILLSAVLNRINPLKPVIDESYRIELDKPILFAQFMPSYINGSGGFTKDTKYKSWVLYSKYDLYNNIQQQQETKGVIVSYLYGYGSQYPVAKIVNSDYITASAFINQSILDNPPTDAAMRTELDKIRTGLAGTKALVTTYTYAPLIGITSQTDPSGHTTYYEYDGLNRLKTVKDQDGHIIKTYDYQYQK